MERVKKRQVLKAWYNLIDVYKKWEFVTKHTREYAHRKLLSRAIKGWKSQVALRVNYFRVHDQRMLKLGVRAFEGLKLMRERGLIVNSFEQQRLTRNKHRFMKAWHMLLSAKLRLHFRFAKRRRFSLLAKSFDTLHVHLKRSRAIRKGLSRVIESRAVRLMGRAFKYGLKRHWRKQAIAKRYLRAAVMKH
jgi:hypothetical protein